MDIQSSKVVTVHNIKTYWGNERKTQLTLNAGTRLTLVMSFMLRPPYPEGKRHRYPMNRRLSDETFPALLSLNLR